MNRVFSRRCIFTRFASLLLFDSYCISHYEILKQFVFIYKFKFFSSMTNGPDDNEECCGNGCNNCVLDKNISITSNLLTKSNVMSKNYIDFRLTSVNQFTDSVFQLEFEYSAPSVSGVGFNKTDFGLTIPLGYHLMLRTKYKENYEPSEEFRNFRGDDDPVHGYTAPKLKHDSETEDGLISRPYTPIDVDSSNLKFKILVKLLQRGLISQYMASLRLGDLTEWKGSYGNFEYIANKYQSIVCISQGVGIAPIYRIIKSVLNDKNDDTRFHLLAVFKDMKNVLLRNELYDMKQFWNFNYTIYLSRGASDSKPTLKYKENLRMYRLDDTEIGELFSSKFFNNQSTVVICGSESFSNYMKRVLLARSFTNFVIL